jgi:serine/threonine-protein kinase HipA
MITGRGFHLAPIYHVMCADAWDGVTRDLAQKIAGKNRGEHLKRRHWQRFAADCGLNATRAVARVQSLANLVLRNTAAAAREAEAMPAGGHTLLPEFSAAIERRARAVLAGIEDVPAEGLLPVAAAPGRTRPRKKAALKPGMAETSPKKTRTPAPKKG